MQTLYQGVVGMFTNAKARAVQKRGQATLEHYTEVRINPVLVHVWRSVLQAPTCANASVRSCQGFAHIRLRMSHEFASIHQKSPVPIVQAAPGFQKLRSLRGGGGWLGRNPAHGQRHKAGGCTPRAGRCPPRGWQQGRDQPTAYGTVHVVRRDRRGCARGAPRSANRQQEEQH